MNAIRKIHSRTVRLLGLIAATVAALAVTAQSAFAQLVPEGPNVGPAATPVVVTHTTTHSGLAVWAVVLIAVGAIAVGAGLRELVRSLARSQRVRRLATSESC
jgi:hypothetical protein